MNDLISRQAAQVIKVLPKCYREYKTGNLDDAYDEGWKDAMFSLNALPTIDPVKHGKWIDGKYMGADGCFVWYRECSLCGYEREDDNLDKDTNYCPNCGAQMERSKDE